MNSVEYDEEKGPKFGRKENNECREKDRLKGLRDYTFHIQEHGRNNDYHIHEQEIDGTEENAESEELAFGIDFHKIYITCRPIFVNNMFLMGNPFLIFIYLENQLLYYSPDRSDQIQLHDYN